MGFLDLKEEERGVGGSLPKRVSKFCLKNQFTGTIQARGSQGMVLDLLILLIDTKIRIKRRKGVRNLNFKEPIALRLIDTQHQLSIAKGIFPNRVLSLYLPWNSLLLNQRFPLCSLKGKVSKIAIIPWFVFSVPLT